MALIDQATIQAQAGRGGDGVVRWLHLKGKEKAGPAGGDGGRGGDVVVLGVRDLAALAQYRFEKKFKAEKGGNGENNNKHGADGEDVILKVPVGSIVRTVATGESIEILSEGQREVIFKGGAGGFGNAHFKSSVNQNPMESREGKQGQGGDIQITLKLIADAGLIGYPNAGKSSLLNELTKARSKVGAYAFTTLEPNLGSFHGYVLADIPGLIEGSATGKGLGIKFLKHIERTSLLIHLVSAERDDVKEAYLAIRRELDEYSPALTQKPEIVLLTKADLLTGEGEVNSKIKALKEASAAPVFPISIIDTDSLKAFETELSRALARS